MSEWKTYAKAARNTARKQAPGARDAAKRVGTRAGDYARAAGRVVDEGRHEDEAPHRGDRPSREDETPREDGRPQRDEAPREATGSRRPDVHVHDDDVHDDDQEDSASRRRSADDRIGTRSANSLRDEAKIYATVAGRSAQRAGTRAREAGVGPRIARAVRDALLIGGSLFVLWGVLHLAGLPIPFSAVLIAVIVVVAIALATSLFAQFRRRPPEDDPDA